MSFMYIVLKLLLCIVKRIILNVYQTGFDVNCMHVPGFHDHITIHIHCIVNVYTCKHTIERNNSD